VVSEKMAAPSVDARSLAVKKPQSFERAEQRLSPLSPPPCLAAWSTLEALPSAVARPAAVARSVTVTPKKKARMRRWTGAMVALAVWFFFLVLGWI
jgi:hypothetical protein